MNSNTGDATHDVTHSHPKPRLSVHVRFRASRELHRRLSAQAAVDRRSLSDYVRLKLEEETPEVELGVPDIKPDIKPT